MSIFLIFVIVGLFSFCHCRTFFFLSLSGFFLFVIVGLDPAIQKIQGRALRYAHRKQRASTKVRTAADNAVKLATTCHVRLWAGHFPHRSPGRVAPEDDTRGDTWAKPKHDNCLPVIFRLSSFLVIPVPSISFVIPRLDRGIPRLPDRVRQWQREKSLEPDISLIDPRDALRPRMTLGETLGLNPNTIVFLWAAVFLPVEKMLLTLI